MPKNDVDCMSITRMHASRGFYKIEKVWYNEDQFISLPILQSLSNFKNTQHKKNNKSTLCATNT